MSTTLSNKVWRFIKVNKCTTELAKIFATKGCGGTIAVIQTFIADKATCLFLCLGLSCFSFQFTVFPTYAFLLFFTFMFEVNCLIFCSCIINFGIFPSSVPWYSGEGV